MHGRLSVNARPPAALAAAARRLSTHAPPPPPHRTLLVCEAAPRVLEVRLNRPAKSNAMSKLMFAELAAAFGRLATEEGCGDWRAVLLTGEGSSFTSGLDLIDHAALLLPPGGAASTAAAGGAAAAPRAEDPARRAWALQRLVRSYQDAVSSLERCPVPVIACIHGACVGGGVDLVCAADVRLASADATFVVKEAELGLAADLGTLQRLPWLVGNDSLVRELAFTARPWPAEEAARHGFLSAVLPDREAMRARALATALRIAALSPLAVAGTKAQLNFARGRPVADGLAFAAAWTGGALQTGDIAVSAARLRGGREAVADDFAPLG